jgi:hypothetical protein
MKKETPGDSFKLFSDSLNMKILPSDLVFFMLIKFFEENVYCTVVYLLFGLIRTTYEK